jgi:hypothetical protein
MKIGSIHSGGGTRLAHLNPMRSLIAALLIFIAFPAVASEGGNHGGGGGVIQEAQFKEIATNIDQWIQSGNANALKLPPGLSKTQFRQKMHKALTHYSIVMSPTRPSVNGKPKTCRGVIDPKPTITCYQPDFASAHGNDINGLYRLEFHEFAGLALVEHNSGADSDYSVSDQVSKYLRDEVVHRLPIEPAEPSKVTSKQLLACGDNQLTLKMKGKFDSAYAMDAITEEQFFKWLRANKKSPLSLAETNAVEESIRDSGIDDSCCSLGTSAPDNGVTIDDASQIGRASTMKRYTEMFEMVHNGHYLTPLLEVEVETSLDLDSSTYSDEDATAGKSQLVLTRIRKFVFNAKGDRVLKTIYEGKTAFELAKCHSIKIPK